MGDHEDIWLEGQEPRYYVIMVIDPVLSTPSQWGPREEELVDSFVGKDALEKAEALKKRMKEGLRWAGSSSMSYFVSINPPKENKHNPLFDQPFDESWAGERLDDDY